MAPITDNTPVRTMTLNRHPEPRAPLPAAAPWPCQARRMATGSGASPLLAMDRLENGTAKDGGDVDRRARREFNFGVNFVRGSLETSNWNHDDVDLIQLRRKIIIAGSASACSIKKLMFAANALSVADRFVFQADIHRHAVEIAGVKHEALLLHFHGSLGSHDADVAIL